MIRWRTFSVGLLRSSAGPGLNQLALTDLASLVEVDDDGRPALRTGPVVEGYEPLGLFRQVWGVGALADGAQQSMMAVNYGGPSGDNWTSVSNTAKVVVFETKVEKERAKIDRPLNGWLDAANDDVVDSQRCDLELSRLTSPLRNGEHDNDARHPEDQAENGEERSQLVHQNTTQCGREHTAPMQPRSATHSATHSAAPEADSTALPAGWLAPALRSAEAKSLVPRR